MCVYIYVLIIYTHTLNLQLGSPHFQTNSQVNSAQVQDRLRREAQACRWGWLLVVVVDLPQRQAVQNIMGRFTLPAASRTLEQHTRCYKYIYIYNM